MGVVKTWVAFHPFTACAVWLIVTCFAAGAVLGVMNVDVFVVLFFGAAWSYLSWIVIDDYSMRYRRTYTTEELLRALDLDK